MSLKSLELSLEKLRPWLTMLAVFWLLASLGLGWLVNSLLIIFGLLLFTPVVAFFGLRWWLQRNLVTDQCPVCNYEFSGLNNTQVQCPNCGEQLSVKQGHFQRFTPEGTIDIQAIEVPTKSLKEQK